MSTVSGHNSASDCWVTIHGKVLDVTAWLDSHPGGPDVFRCGEDLTAQFEGQHGNLTELEARVEQYSSMVKLLGELEEEEEEDNEEDEEGLSDGAAPREGFVEYDFTEVTRQVAPGNGNEFKTLIYIELKGGLDSAAAFVNVKTEEEIHLWCSKRPTLSAEEHCECLETGAEVDEQTGTESEVCTRYALLDHHKVDELNEDLAEDEQKKKVYPMQNTEGYLAMTHFLAGCNSTSWLPLWDGADMAVAPGVGRYDHQRSHFEVKDAAAKGVSTEEEPSTRHGWLAKSIFAFNSLYCQRGEPEADCHKSTNRSRMVDGISLMNTAAGPNALEVSDSSISGSSFLHVTGVANVDSLVDTELYNYNDPFMVTISDDGNSTIGGSSGNAAGTMAGAEQEHTGEDNDEDDGEGLESNTALEDLLDKEETTFNGIGVVQELLDKYMEVVAEKCPTFPDTEAWADTDSDGEIGMQLRTVAILLLNGVCPKALIGDLRTGVHTFVHAAKECGFWDDTLLVIFSEFGRRFEENSKKGTDHGWGHYPMLFGKDLRRQVYGFDASTNTSSLENLVPSHADSYNKSLGTKGDLQMKTDIEAFNACVLDAMGLPGLWRLGDCPSEMRLRENLTNVPRFEESRYYATATADNEGAVFAETSTWNGNKSYLSDPLTRAEVLHVSRRIGFSPKSLGLDQYLPTNYTGAMPTLGEVISQLLGEENLNKGLNRSLEIYHDYQYRNTQKINLYNSKLRASNIWRHLHKLPYPRQDRFEQRVRRWRMERFFDMASVAVTAGGRGGMLYEGSVNITSEFVGREGEILQEIQQRATSFYLPYAIYFDEAKGQYENLRSEVNATTGEVLIEDVHLASWYQTVMFASDVLEVAGVTVEEILEDWRCDNTTGTHPNDPNTTCDPQCDLPSMLNISVDAESAYLADNSWKGPDGTKYSSSWYILRACTEDIDPGSDWLKHSFEQKDQVRTAVQNDLFSTYQQDFRNPETGFRARMTWFFLNWYATPLSGIDDDYLLMSHQYSAIWGGAVGNYRELATVMFSDQALRLSLDQLEEVECGTAPVENFAREYFERFTVGLEAHNEGDIKRLAKGLMNCKEDHETDNEDLVTPGMIFSDLNESVWTFTPEDRKAVVDRVLDFRTVASEPPAAAQRLCSKLYQEFGVSPGVGSNGTLSSMSLPPAVVECAAHLYSHNFELVAALEYILEDKPNFKGTLGQKSRWPTAVIFGPWADFDVEMSVWRGSNWNKLVGMPIFEPQDVSGFDLDNVWTLDRVSSAHEWLDTKVAAQARSWFNKLQFTDIQTMQSALAAYQVPGTSDLYSFALYICDWDLFVPEEGEEELHIINATYLFDTSIPEHSSKYRRYKVWTTAVDTAITNVCQFLT
eukprot:gene3337-4195_t